MPTQVLTTTYGAAALTCLTNVVSQIKHDDPMTMTTIVVPNHLAGMVVQRHLSAQGGIAGLQVTTLPRLAERIAAPNLAPRRPQTRAIRTATWRASLDADPGEFAKVSEHPATTRALALAHRELRDLDQSGLDRVAAHNDLSADVIRLHRQVVDVLSERWYDETDLLHEARRHVENGQVSSLGQIVLYLPQAFTNAETGFAQALADQAPLTVLAGLNGYDDADRAIHRTLDRLGLAGQQDSQQPLATKVLHASDADDEVRCVVRRVVTTLQQTPAHRIAILYAAQVPYARLLQEHLAAADLVVNGPGVRSVRNRAVARGFMQILQLARTGVSRAGLFTALAQAPVRSWEGGAVPVSRWDRLSRTAGIVAGDDWQQRLDTFIDDQLKFVTNADTSDEEVQWRIERANSTIEDARQLQGFVSELRDRLEAGGNLTTWFEVSSWALALFGDLYEASRLPREEQYAVVAIAQSLAALSGLETRATLTLLQEVLDLDLEVALPSVGRFGDGVLVAPVSAAIGLDLDTVFVVGLSEDAFPGRQSEDPLLPQALRRSTGDALPGQRERIDAMHRHLAAAFSSAPEVWASFPRGDLRRSVTRLPSRWLLPTLRALSGTPGLTATSWDETEAPNIIASRSFWDELRSASDLATDHEWQMRTVSAGDDLDDTVITAARHLQDERASARFTRFDGNLRSVEGLPDYARSDRAVSPTSLEQYATCPHQFFVSRVLGIRPLTSPEEIIKISAMDVGTLIHECLDELVQAFPDDLPDYGRPWLPQQRSRLREIAAQKALDFEERGLTGHRLLWEHERDQIMDDLEAMLDADNEFRQRRDARVLSSELRFGLGGHEPVRIPVPRGEVKMRGSADKVDQTRDGALLVCDIKTGGNRTFVEIADNPVVRGTKLQLPVYAYAARARHGGENVEAFYWFVRRDRGRISIQLGESLDTTYRETIATLVGSIAAGHFPAKAPDEPDFAWVQCEYCNPDRLGHGEARTRYESKRHDPTLAALIALIDPDAVQP